MTITEIMNNASTHAEMGRPFSFNASAVNNAPAKVAKMPWELTNEELLEMRGLPSRKDAIKLMRKQLDDLLEACKIYDKRTPEAMEEIYKDWFVNNLPMIEKLERCKNYTGYFEVESDICYENGADRSELCDFVNDMLVKLIPLGTFNRWATTTVTYNYNGVTYSAGEFRTNPIATMKWETSRVLTDDRADKINSYLTEEEKSRLRIVSGTKTTKVMNKLMTYFGVDKIINDNKEIFGCTYDAWFAKYAEIFSSQRANYKYICGVNMVSFATSSFGSNWRSCHNIDKDLNAYHQNGDYSDGCHAAGSFSYMCDKSTMVSYVLSSKADGRTTIYGNVANASEYCLVPKIYRNMIHVSDDGKRFIQGRVYPQSIDSNKVLADAINEEHKKLIAEMWSNNVNDWITENERRSFYSSSNVFGGDYGQAYADYSHYSVSRQNYFSGSEMNPITIGKSPKCICCGRGMMVDDNLYCCVCTDDLTCSYCGESFNSDDAYRYGDVVYCSLECASGDGVCMCCRCGELFCEDSAPYFGSEYYCTYCAERIGIVQCERCGEWIYKDGAICAGESYFCSDYCAEVHGYVRCDECGEWALKYDAEHDAIYAGGFYFCDHECAENYGFIQCEECGEWISKDEAICAGGLCLCCDECAEILDLSK